MQKKKEKDTKKKQINKIKQNKNTINIAMVWANLSWYCPCTLRCTCKTTIVTENKCI